MSILRLSYHVFGAVAFILIALDLLQFINIPTWLLISSSVVLAICLGIFSYFKRKEARARPSYSEK